MKLFIFFMGVVCLSARARAQSQCEPLTAPRYGSLSCTDGSNKISRCSVTCDEDYGIRRGTHVHRRCRCSNSGVCSWTGVEAVCDYTASTPIVCDIPDFMKASYAVVDVGPTMVFLRVKIKPTSQTRQGWSFALIFSKPLPQADLEIESGHVTMVAMSEDRRVVTFNSLPHVRDISSLDVFSLHILIKNFPTTSDPSINAALIGFYPKIVRDASCIQDISPVRPLPTTTTVPPTSTRSTAPPTRRTTTTRATTTRPTATRPTTTRPTTTRATTTTSTQQPTSAGECEELTDPSQPGYLLLNNGWSTNEGWRFNARVEKYPDSKGPLARWVMKIEFSQPVDKIEVHVARAEGPLQGGLLWLFHPQDWNDGVGGGEGNDPLRIQFLGTSFSGTSGPIATVTFCRNGATPDMSISGGGASTTPIMTSSTTTTPPIPGTTTTASPNFLTRCRSTSPSSFSNLPIRSRETVATNYIASDYPTMFDYNEVIHKSILFYEAQRSGKLPSNNRIPWRGDSGLKHGCDVSVDLTGGYYDAGDNIKFGFPMSYTTTVLAWGMLEFQDGYADSGNWQNALDMLKWATDYFVRAHTAKYELYVQVGDGMVDHGKWLRPEDIKFVQKSYKIDRNNPGSDVAAETAAALAASSMVFRPIDPAYADMLSRHAIELYDFADKYRGVYHNSVPGVEDYYKSWNGFNDELLWAAVWLHRATGQQSYLNIAKQRYQPYGGANRATEFSWDTKYPGVQVLIAQTTGERKYVANVEESLEYAMNLEKTPDGLTWKSQWGANRYAANFAFIALMAAKVVPTVSNSRTYISYATSQINYMLGDNKIDGEGGRSLVVGMNPSSPVKPHHRASSCPKWNSRPVAKCDFSSLNNNGPNPHVLFGALVGGPNLQGQYTDDRRDYISNEVATDYNAGFQSAVAGLQYFTINGS